jgi:hypothetical protein
MAPSYIARGQTGSDAKKGAGNTLCSRSAVNENLCLIRVMSIVHTLLALRDGCPRINEFIFDRDAGVVHKLRRIYLELSNRKWSQKWRKTM